jgi:hypothetical protein
LGSGAVDRRRQELGDQLAQFFTRTAAVADAAALLADSAHRMPATSTFLVGSWKVRHRKLTPRLAGSRDWVEFDGTLVNWPVLGGRGNVGDNVMNFPGAPHTAASASARSIPRRGEWLSWWLDGREARHASRRRCAASFADGIGSFDRRR